jgi:hypothetical protein
MNDIHTALMLHSHRDIHSYWGRLHYTSAVTYAAFITKRFLAGFLAALFTLAAWSSLMRALVPNPSHPSAVL